MSAGSTRRCTTRPGHRDIGALGHRGIGQLVDRGLDPSENPTPSAQARNGCSEPVRHEVVDRLIGFAQTVKTHVSKVSGKRGVRDRAQAVVYAYEHGVVTLGS